MQAGGVLALALALGACSASPSGRAVETAAELPLRVVSQHLLVPAQLNDQPVWMLVDTGASATVVTEAAAQRLHMEAVPERVTTTSAIDGQRLDRNVWMASMRLGQVVMTAHPVPVAIATLGEVDGKPVAGAIGTDLLAAFDVESDVPHGRLGLYRVHDCTGPLLPWGTAWDAPLSGAGFVLPLSVHAGHFVTVPVTVDGRALAAMVDWGAAISAMPMATAARLGVSAAALERDPSGRISGAAGVAIAVHRHVFAEMGIGPQRLRHVIIPVGDYALPTGDITLGEDYLAHQRVWLSYATQQMFVLPATIRLR